MGRVINVQLMVGFELPSDQAFEAELKKLPSWDPSIPLPPANTIGWVEWLVESSDFAQAKDGMNYWADVAWDTQECYGYWVGIPIKKAYSDVMAYSNGGTTGSDIKENNVAINKMKELYPDKGLKLIIRTYIG